MIPSNGYFNGYMNSLKNNINKSGDILYRYDSLCSASKELMITKIKLIVDETLKVKKLDTSILANLEDIKWMVQKLDPEKHKPMIQAYSVTLETLGTKMHEITEYLTKCKELVSDEDKKTLDQELSRMNQIISNEFKDTMEAIKLKSIGKDTSKGLTQKSIDFWSYMSSPTNTVILSSCSFFSKPKCVSEYFLKDEKNQKDRIIEVVSTMKEPVSLATFGHSSGQVIADKYGEQIEVPQQFGKDLTRYEKFTVNNQVILEKKGDELIGNPNEVARDLYALCGRIGGVRVMQLCNQGMFAYMLEKYVQSDSSVFGKPSDESLYIGKMGGLKKGVICDITIDNQNKTAIVSMKQVLKLVTLDSPVSSIGIFVMKMTFTVPMSVLTQPTLKDDNLEALDIQTEDKISKVVDNEKEAFELLEKF